MVARKRLKTTAATRFDESVRLRVELDAFTPELMNDPAAALMAYNQRFLETELVEWRSFFDHCEERPLTTAQARAAISGEENTLLVAAAGSGKTSTVLGRVAYAIAKGLAAPRDIVCLAFNNGAVEEIGKRVKKRLAALMAEEIPITAGSPAALHCLARASGGPEPLADNQIIFGLVSTELPTRAARGEQAAHKTAAFSFPSQGGRFRGYSPAGC